MRQDTHTELDATRRMMYRVRSVQESLAVAGVEGEFQEYRLFTVDPSYSPGFGVALADLTDHRTHCRGPSL